MFPYQKRPGALSNPARTEVKIPPRPCLAGAIFQRARPLYRAQHYRRLFSPFLLNFSESVHYIPVDFPLCFFRGSRARRQTRAPRRKRHDGQKPFKYKWLYEKVHPHYPGLFLLMSPISGTGWTGYRPRSR